jgi:hypothetical protein
LLSADRIENKALPFDDLETFMMYTVLFLGATDDQNIRDVVNPWGKI